MNIADRIQHLRKANGLSQEELADKIGVSRQSVSKWESEQASPDIDKIILLSDFFEVTTDYLLKGIEPAPTEINCQKSKPDIKVFAIIATAFDLLGLIIACFIWFTTQTPVPTAIGLIFMVMGLTIFTVGLVIGEPATRTAAIKTFWIINIWILSFIPLSLVYNAFFGISSAPYPILFINRFVGFLLFWIAYFTVGTVTAMAMRKYGRRS